MQLFKVTIKERKSVSSMPISIEELEANQESIATEQDASSILLLLAGTEAESLQKADKLISDLQGAATGVKAADEPLILSHLTKIRNEDSEKS